MQGKIIKGIAGFYYVYAEDAIHMNAEPREFSVRINSSLW